MFKYLKDNTVFQKQWNERTTCANYISMDTVVLITWASNQAVWHKLPPGTWNEV